jgi:hypothetical protein
MRSTTEVAATTRRISSSGVPAARSTDASIVSVLAAVGEAEGVVGLGVAVAVPPGRIRGPLVADGDGRAEVAGELADGGGDADGVEDGGVSATATSGGPAAIITTAAMNAADS